MTIQEQDYNPNVVLESDKYRVIGSRPTRQDGYDRITGRAKYTADVNLPGTFYAKILRSPHAHANIKSIDTSKAQNLPGVRAIITSKDFGFSDDEMRNPIGYETFGPPKQAILAYHKVYYVGHPVAAVAADDPNIAEEALSLIQIDYEVLPHVLTAWEGIKDDAPLLHDNLNDNSNNVATHIRYEKGDLQKGFGEADFIIEREFYTGTVHQGYIEPHVSTALWDKNGRIYLWTSTQGHFQARDVTAMTLGIPPSQVKITPSEIGGGFGGKLAIYLEPIVALLSKKTGHPVKSSMTRKEVMEATGPASGTFIKVKMGATKDGKLTAGEAIMQYDLGAFPGASAMSRGVIMVFAPYDIENVITDGQDIVVNKPSCKAYRAPGAPQVAFAAEQVVDELANKIGIDPLEFRYMNAAQEGTRRHDGIVYPKIGFKEVLEATKNHPHYTSSLERKGSDGKLRGRGVASGLWVNAGAASSATLAVQYDGTVGLITGSIDVAGAKTALAMQAAEALGLDVEDVQATVGDTDSVGWTNFSAGSRTIFATGIAVYEAAQKLLNEMKDRLGLIWDIPSEQINFSNGLFNSNSDPKRKITFKELAGELEHTGGTITSSASVDPAGVGATLGTHIADVEVDPETGKVDVIRYTVIQDAGKAIHPSYVEGQMQGGAVQGIGWALNEEYYYDDKGQMVNSSFLDYRMPTSLDVPMIDTVIVEVTNPGHPYGVRGVGENNIVPPMATIANAIQDAIGVRMTQLPMKPIRILEALWNKDKA